MGTVILGSLPKVWPRASSLTTLGGGARTFGSSNKPFLLNGFAPNECGCGCTQLTCFGVFRGRVSEDADWRHS